MLSEIGDFYFSLLALRFIALILLVQKTLNGNGQFFLAAIILASLFWIRKL